ncbi:MAG: hypothetical protein R2752_17275 [Vicinamibacterales bacterium]
MKLVGFALVVIGIVGLLWGGISWTQQEKVVDMGPLQVNKETEKSLPVPPIAGAICLVVGAGLIVVGRRR